MTPGDCAGRSQVIEVTEKGRVRLEVTLAPEPDFSAVRRKEARLAATYFPSKTAALIFARSVQPSLSQCS